MGGGKDIPFLLSRFPTLEIIPFRKRHKLRGYKFLIIRSRDAKHCVSTAIFTTIFTTMFIHCSPPLEGKGGGQIRNPQFVIRNS